MKLLVSDFDGTLSSDHRSINDANIDAIKQWRKKGNKFAIATGRSYFMIEPVIRRTGLEVDYVICNNGGAIYHNDEVVYSEKLGIHIDDLDPFIKDYHVTAINATDLKGLYFNAFLRKLSLKSLMFFFYVRFVEVKEKMIKRKHLEELIQITLMTKSKEEAARLAGVINETFDVNAIPNASIIDIGKGNITKASALHHLNDEVEAFDEIYTIGDELNDLEMISDFTGFTMTKGLEVLKKVANKSYNEVSELVLDLIRGDHNEAK